MFKTACIAIAQALVIGSLMYFLILLILACG